MRRSIPTQMGRRHIRKFCVLTAECERCPTCIAGCLYSVHPYGTSGCLEQRPQVHWRSGCKDGNCYRLERRSHFRNRLEDNATTPSINTFIVLVPDAARRGRTDGYRTARTHDAGIFKIGKIPAGEFKSFPWNDVDEDEWLVSDFLRKHEKEGTPVHIEALSRPSVALPVLP
jgi:hypothetical protein